MIETASVPLDNLPMPHAGLVDDHPSATASHATVVPEMLFVM